jgi:serine/threonine protein kinase
VVHRDLSPNNVIVTASSRDPYAIPQVTLIDFGLSKQLLDNDSHVTETGDLLGTLGC